jgi:hypothetical protein
VVKAQDLSPRMSIESFADNEKKNPKIEIASSNWLYSKSGQALKVTPIKTNPY